MYDLDKFRKWFIDFDGSSGSSVSSVSSDGLWKKKQVEWVKIDSFCTKVVQFEIQILNEWKQTSIDEWSCRLQVVIKYVALANKDAYLFWAHSCCRFDDLAVVVFH